VYSISFCKLLSKGVVVSSIVRFKVTVILIANLGMVIVITDYPFIFAFNMDDFVFCTLIAFGFLQVFFSIHENLNQLFSLDQVFTFTN
jgi:hypothetical protein